MSHSRGTDRSVVVWVICEPGIPARRFVRHPVRHKHSFDKDDAGRRRPLDYGRAALSRAGLGLCSRPSFTEYSAPSCCRSSPPPFRSVGPDRRAASLALGAARARDRQLGSYGAAKRKIMPGVEHPPSRYLNNRAEVSHQPTRRRERQMQRFKSARHAQRFLSAHSRIHNHFQLRRHRLSAIEYRAARGRAFSTWREVVGVAAAI